MDNSNGNFLSLAAATNQYSITPGTSLEIQLTLVNLGEVVDQVRINVEGIPLVWVSTEQPVLLLQPGEERQFVLTIKPPASPHSQIGRYTLIVQAMSNLVSSQRAVVQIALTVAGFEVKGRLGMLLEGVNFVVTPGETLNIPMVLINQGLAPDSFQLAVEDLPQGWVFIQKPTLELEPGEVKEATVMLLPPRQPDTRPGRHVFHLLVASHAAQEQVTKVRCTLTVAAFTEFKADLKTVQPEPGKSEQPTTYLEVENTSNVPATFQAEFTSPEDSLSFEPQEAELSNLPAGEMGKLEFTTKPASRLWFGGEKSFPYTAKVLGPDGKSQSLDGLWIAKGLIPVWVMIVAVMVIVLLCLGVLLPRFLDRLDSTTITPTAAISPTMPTVLVTVTQSPIDQISLLIERKWFLVSFNQSPSVAGNQEAFSLFNPDGTLIGFTGCKDYNASYQTSFNSLSITEINLGRGNCPDSAAQQQEDALISILRGAENYFVADTALQVAGNAGFLNYSLTPVNRPEETSPPQAVIRGAVQAQAGEVVVFDGTASSGQSPIVTWNWDFGDGSQASGPTVQHIYTTPGSFTVRLTVVDQRNQNGNSTQPIQILAAPTIPPPTLPPPTATPVPDQPTATPQPEPPTPEPQPNPPQASLSGPRDGFVGEPVTFDASGSQPGSNPIVSYTWTFGDGTSLPASPNPQTSAIYTRTGIYEVSVIVADANGLSGLAVQQITINARLETDVWTLSTLNEVPLLPGTAITLQFLNGELAGFAGCNTYSGRYTASDNGDGTFSVVIQQVQVSRKTCPPEIMQQEEAYMQALQQTDIAVVQGNSLTLNQQSGRLVFFLVKPLP